MSIKNKTPNQERVILELSREQAMIIERACELFARLKIGQFNHITEQMMEYDPGRKEDLLKGWCSRRDMANDILRCAANVIYGQNACGWPEILKDVYHHRAWDVYQVLRYTRCWHDNPKGNQWSVCYDTPMSLIEEPLPKCEITEVSE